MTEPLRDPPAVIVRDPDAHAKLDALSEKVSTILDWIQGDAMQGISGAASQIRKNSERLERHSGRIRDLEERVSAVEGRGTEQIRWGLKTFAEQALKAAAAAAIGGLIVLFASKQPAPQGGTRAPQSHFQAPDLRAQR